ncbi:hypothetical protein PAPYR_9746 [Paratrimastix pyriformis]|uniref:Uncharacterized protein n=1 Tax=Paratrimastix pyriformis TaxID=342808 RepID=A0ABQ8U7N5_9EUKA|nr:hypothetical protein PAPYR_9746 [Paratrimastix pyriformis]
MAIYRTLPQTWFVVPGVVQDLRDPVSLVDLGGTMGATPPPPDSGDLSPIQQPRDPSPPVSSSNQSWVEVFPLERPIETELLTYSRPLCSPLALVAPLPVPLREGTSLVSLVDVNILDDECGCLSPPGLPPLHSIWDFFPRADALPRLIDPLLLNTLQPPPEISSLSLLLGATQGRSLPCCPQSIFPDPLDGDNPKPDGDFSRQAVQVEDDDRPGPILELYLPQRHVPLFDEALLHPLVSLLPSLRARSLPYKGPDLNNFILSLVARNRVPLTSLTLQDLDRLQATAVDCDMSDIPGLLPGTLPGQLHSAKDNSLLYRRDSPETPAFYPTRPSVFR